MLTDAELDRLERELGRTLPVAYRQLMREFPEELIEWPPLPGETANRRIEDFLVDVEEIVLRHDDAIEITLEHGSKVPPRLVEVGGQLENRGRKIAPEQK